MKTYEERKKETCEWCAKGIAFAFENNSIHLEMTGDMWPNAVSRHQCTAISHEDYEAELRAEIAALRQALTAISTVPATIPSPTGYYETGRMAAWLNAAAMARSALNQSAVKESSPISNANIDTRLILGVSRDKLLEAQRHTGLNYSDLIARIDMVLADASPQPESAERNDNAGE